ncbi:MAG: Gfo/Idh/MocA family oxidoreductase [Oligoflexia bacterium]|nr:Gfo/Idh/MocA family oxidoreductase [Oligoflexia bacterium]
MKNPLHFALVGCGRIAQRHAELLGSGQINGAKLVAVCDWEEVKARKIAQRFTIPYYAEMNDMMNHEDIDVACVLTPSGMHAQHVTLLSQHKKHIVVEKPMALTLESADAMIAACVENGIKLFVVKQNRFNLPIRKLKEALDHGRFGKLVMGTVRVRWCRTQEYYNESTWRGTWQLDGGVFTNQASHHIDLLEWMMGDVESVFAKGQTALVDIETEDTGVAVLKFKNGALGIIEATTATRPRDLEGSISILGEKGTVVVAGFAVNKIDKWIFADKKEEDSKIIEECSENPPDVYGFGHQVYLNHVVDCINSNKKALIDGLEGRKSLELISAIYESIETGREVYLRFKPQKCKLGQGVPR